MPLGTVTDTHQYIAVSEFHHLGFITICTSRILGNLPCLATIIGINRIVAQCTSPRCIVAGSNHKHQTSGMLSMLQLNTATRTGKETMTGTFAIHTPIYLVGNVDDFPPSLATIGTGRCISTNQAGCIGMPQTIVTREYGHQISFHFIGNDHGIAITTLGHGITLRHNRHVAPSLTAIGTTLGNDGNDVRQIAQGITTLIGNSHQCTISSFHQSRDAIELGTVFTHFKQRSSFRSHRSFRGLTRRESQEYKK